MNNEKTLRIINPIHGTNAPKALIVVLADDLGVGEIADVLEKNNGFYNERNIVLTSDNGL